MCARVRTRSVAEPLTPNLRARSSRTGTGARTRTSTSGEYEHEYEYEHVDRDQRHSLLSMATMRETKSLPCSAALAGICTEFNGARVHVQPLEIQRST